MLTLSRSANLASEVVNVTPGKNGAELHTWIVGCESAEKSYVASFLVRVDATCSLFAESISFHSQASFPISFEMILRCVQSGINRDSARLWIRFLCSARQRSSLNRIGADSIAWLRTSGLRVPKHFFSFTLAISYID